MKRREHNTKQARWLSAIQSLGNQLKNLDCDGIAQATIEALSKGLGFGQVALFLINKSDLADPDIRGPNPYELRPL